jgi:hypothetical protein
VKLTADRPFADPEAAARRLLEIAKQVVPVMKGRIYIEQINGPFLFRDRASPAEYGAGLKLLIERKELLMHDSGTFVWLPDAEPTLLGDQKQAKPAQHLLPSDSG